MSSVDDRHSELWAQLRALNEARRPPDPPQADAPLRDQDGERTSGNMEVVDAKIAAAEARTDTKFADLRTDLAVQFGEIKADLARKPGTGALIGAAIGIVAVILAALAFAGSRFDSGMTARSLVEQVQVAQHQRDDAQDAKLDEILRRLPPVKAAPAHP